MATRPLSPHHKRSFSTRHTSPRPSSLHSSQHHQHHQHRLMPTMIINQPATTTNTNASIPEIPPPPSSNHNRRQTQPHVNHQQGRRGSTTGGAQNLSLNHNNSSSNTASPQRAHNNNNKASYFFPELTQGCLFFRDFIPALVEKGGTFSSPQYEPFSKLVERANVWIVSELTVSAIQIIKAECIQIRASHNTEHLSSVVSFHPDYVDWGMHLTGLRLWCRQQQQQQTAPTTTAQETAAEPPPAPVTATSSRTKPVPSPVGGSSPLTASNRGMSLDVENNSANSQKHMYLSPDTSSPRLSPGVISSDAATSSSSDASNTSGTAAAAAQQPRSSPRPTSATSSRASSDPTTPPMYTGRLGYLDVLPDLVHAGVRSIEYERLSTLVAKLNQKILDKRACNILSVQTVSMRLHSNETPDTECTCFSLHGHKQKCRLLFLRVFYFMPRASSSSGTTPPSRSSPREEKIPAANPSLPSAAHSAAHVQNMQQQPARSPTEPLSHASSAASSRRSSLSREAHQQLQHHQKLLTQLAEHQQRTSSSQPAGGGGRHAGSSPSSRRGSGAYKEEIGLADFVPQIVRTGAYGKQGIEGMTSLARRAGEWFKRYREEHPDIRLVNFQTVTYYVRDWKHVDTERTFIMTHGDSDTFQYEHRALRIFYSRYVECVPPLPPFPLIDLKTFAPRQLNTPSELADTRFESAIQTAAQIDQWLAASDSESAKKLLDIETFDVTYSGVQDTAKAIEVPYLYAESRDKFVLTCFFLYYTDDETSAARKETMELSPWHGGGSNGTGAAMGGSRRHSIATMNLRNKVAREDENPDGCSLM